MTLTEAMDHLSNNHDSAEDWYHRFFAELTNQNNYLGGKLVWAVMQGSRHLHASSILPGTPWDSSAATINFSDPSQYARYVYEKRGNLQFYFNALNRCAGASRLDLNTVT